MPVAVPLAEPIDATVVVVLLHVPVGVRSVSVVEPPTQIARVPLMAVGLGNISITVVVVVVPHALVDEKVIVAVPAATPVTIPVLEPTVAFALLLLHVPDVPVAVASLSVIVDPTHTVSLPVIAPAKGYAHIITLPLPQVVLLSFVVTVITPEPPT